MKKFSLLLLFSFFFVLHGFAQEDIDWIFDDTSLPEVYIKINQDSLDQFFEPEGWYSDHEYPATFIFKRNAEIDTVRDIGFRIRGNTSRASQKKSFKVSFNTFVDGREYHGLDKMNLNGEHNDPSIIRSKLSWYLFDEIDIPASRSNHV
jgi:spore coat protein CotH